MIRKRMPQRFGKKEFVKANQFIRFPQVRVLTERGEMIGVMSSFEAQQRAIAEDKDLVLVTEKADPPLVKIINLAKYKYQLKQKQAEGRKAAHKQDTKEIRFSPFIGDADFETRMRKIKGFLEKGDKVRLTIEFKGGRQLSKKEFGFEMIKKIFDQTAEIAVIEIQPKLLGKKIMAQIMPVKKGKGTATATTGKI